MTPNDLKQLERSTFRAAADTGLWDIFLASVLSMMAIGPYLSVPLGDFWASAVFLPLWLGVWLGIRAVQNRVVVPRVGVVKFGPDRKRRLTWLSTVMLVVNLVALVLGIVAATRGGQADGRVVSFGLAFTLLVGFSMGAFVLGIPRLFAYGLLLALASVVGEELWRRGLASHHGFPMMFGASALIILAAGIVRFVTFLLRAGTGRKRRSGAIMSDAGEQASVWLDTLIHSPARFMIVRQLYVTEAADATFLVNRTGLTWGNLSSHISRLEEAGYVAVEKNFRGKKPCTMIGLTDKGRAAFEGYRAGMQKALAELPEDA